MYDFKPEFLIGIKELDEEHRKIFALTDEAYYLLKDENMLFKREELDKILKGIHEYTIKHFKDEEAYMEKIQFPELKIQKIQHRRFEEKLQEFLKQAEDISLKSQDKILLELLDYLAGWLQTHILESDMKYKEKTKEEQK